MSLDDWKDEFWSMKGCTEDDRTAFKKAWLRARERLVAVNKVTIGSNWVWLKSTIDFSTGDKGDKDVYIYSDK